MLRLAILKMSKLGLSNKFDSCELPGTVNKIIYHSKSISAIINGFDVSYTLQRKPYENKFLTR